MKSLKNIATVFSVAMFFFNAQAQQNIFVKGYEVPQASFVQYFELIKTYDKGYMAGNAGFLLKTDSLGNMQFMRQNTFASPYSIDKTYDGGYVGSGSGGIIKLDSAGNIIWFKQFNSITSYSINVVRETPDHGFIVAGGISIGSTGGILLVKTDSLANVQWSGLYRTTMGGATSLVLTADNGYLLCGDSRSLINNPIWSDICAIKIDSIGNPQWGKHYTVLGIDFSIKRIIVTSDSNYIICGGMGGQYLLKIDSAGNQLWMKQYFLQIPSVAQSVEETPDKGFIMGGYWITFGGVLMKTDSMGDFEWVNVLGGATVFGGSVKPASDGGYVMAARANGANGHGIIIFKTDSLGQTGGCMDAAQPVTVNNVNDTIISVPVFDSVLSVTTSPVTITFNNVGNVYDLCPTGIQNLQDITEFTLYPNPATTRITLQYNNTANAALQILDITGRRIKQMAVSKASTTTTIDVSDLPAGMYFYSLSTASEKSKTGKFVKE